MPAQGPVSQRTYRHAESREGALRTAAASSAYIGKASILVRTCQRANTAFASILIAVDPVQSERDQQMSRRSRSGHSLARIFYA